MTHTSEELRYMQSWSLERKIQETHPRQWKYCMDVLGLREVLEYIGVKYE